MKYIETERVGTKRIRRSREERRRWVAEYRRSGLTQEAFAAASGINVASLRNWIYSPGEGGRAVRFAEVEVRASVPGAGAGASSDWVRVRWPHGEEMDVPVTMASAKWVREVLR